MLHPTIPGEVTKIFAKEAYLLSQIGCKNVVGVLGLCDKPVPIIMEYLEFLFFPFGRDLKVNSLDRLLHTLNEGDLVSHFPGIDNHIACDIISVVSYFHNKNIIHTDIKPSTVIVNNLHYSSREG